MSSMNANVPDTPSSEADAPSRPGTRGGPTVAVVGGGFMATVHSRAARAARARLRGLVSSSPERSQYAATDLGFERAYASLGELVSDRELDVVHVTTPNALHADQVLAVLRAGLHVVCEKPLATSAVDARSLVHAADEAGLVGTVPFVYRYHPMVREARALVAAGEIGEILTIDAAYLQDWLLSAGDANWRATGTAGGRSRAFADIGSHLVDLLEFVTGDRIVRLSARTRTVFAERGGRPVANEDLAALLVEFAAGSLGSLLVSQMAAGRKNGLVFELHGSHRAVRFEQENPETLWIGDRASSTVRLREAATLHPDAARLSIVPSGHPMGYQDAFDGFVRDAYAAIGGARPDGLPTFRDGLRAALVTEAVLSSAAGAGAWTTVVPD